MKKQSDLLIILKISGGFTALFIVFDIVGATVIAIKYLLWLSSKSMMFLAFPIWFVVAVFNGAFYTDYGIKNLRKSEYLQNKTWLVTIIAVVFSLLFLLFFEYFDQLNINGTEEYWVPGNLGLTITYFITLCLTTLIFKNKK